MRNKAKPYELQPYEIPVCEETVNMLLEMRHYISYMEKEYLGRKLNIDPRTIDSRFDQLEETYKYHIVETDGDDAVEPNESYLEQCRRSKY